MTYDPYERSAADGKDANEAEARGEPITAVALTCRCAGSRPVAFCGHTHETVADALACPVRRADRGFATWVTVRASTKGARDAS